MRKRPKITGLLIWAVCALIGAGVLWIAVRSSDQLRGAVNHSVCGFRALAEPQLDRARKGAVDPTVSASTRARSRQAVAAITVFLATQVTSPKDYDCRKIAKVGG